MSPYSPVIPPYINHITYRSHMKILVLNCGSSSVKYKLIDTATDATMAEGGVEKIGLPDGFLKFKRPMAPSRSWSWASPTMKAR